MICTRSWGAFDFFFTTRVLPTQSRKNAVLAVMKAVGTQLMEVASCNRLRLNTFNRFPVICINKIAQIAKFVYS